MTAVADHWLEHVEPTEEREENEPDLINFEIMNYPADTTLSGYKSMHDNRQLRIPDFQRKFVWDQVRASKLIESFLLGLPVPGVFLYKEKDEPYYLVIDGNQRITTIVSFLSGFFKEKKFSLRGVSSKWEGKSFKELSEEEKFKLSTAVMRSTIIQQLFPDDNSSIYYIFERLNTGGVNLNPMEVRACIGHGDFIKLLHELNKYTKWRTILNKQTVDDRLRDVELILRTLVLYDLYKLYDKPMKRFLNKYIEKNKNPNGEFLNLRRIAFLSAVDKACLLDERPFHRKGKLNYAMLDSVLIGLMKSPLESQQELKERYQSLLSDEEYISAVTQNTSDKAEIDKRISKAIEIFL